MLANEHEYSCRRSESDGNVSCWSDTEDYHCFSTKRPIKSDGFCFTVLKQECALQTENSKVGSSSKVGMGLGD